jgi:ribosome-binding factor A
MEQNESKRQQKVAKLVQRDLGEIFREEGQTRYRGTMISVTKVYITRDLGLARAYLSIFGGDSNKVFESISERNHEIRHKLGNLERHQLRSIPELHFFLDDSLDYLENIENLLKE